MSRFRQRLQRAGANVVFQGSDDGFQRVTTSQPQSPIDRHQDRLCVGAPFAAAAQEVVTHLPGRPKLSISGFGGDALTPIYYPHCRRYIPIVVRTPGAISTFSSVASPPVSQIAELLSLFFGSSEQWAPAWSRSVRLLAFALTSGAEARQRRGGAATRAPGPRGDPPIHRERSGRQQICRRNFAAVVPKLTMKGPPRGPARAVCVRAQITVSARQDRASLGARPCALPPRNRLDLWRTI